MSVTSGTKTESGLGETIRVIIHALLIALVIRTFLFQPFNIPSGSMIPSLLPGDLVWVNKLAYDLKVPFTTCHIVEWSNPKRGDIVVFFSPRDGQRLVKRVVGLPGDTIELRNNALVLNGQPVSYQPIAEELLRDLAVTFRCSETVRSVEGVLEGEYGYQEVNSVFGEGFSPRLRKSSRNL